VRERRVTTLACRSHLQRHRRDCSRMAL